MDIEEEEEVDDSRMSESDAINVLTKALDMILKATCNNKFRQKVFGALKVDYSNQAAAKFKTLLTKICERGRGECNGDGQIEGPPATGWVSVLNEPVASTSTAMLAEARKKAKMHKSKLQLIASRSSQSRFQPPPPPATNNEENLEVISDSDSDIEIVYEKSADARIAESMMRAIKQEVVDHDEQGSSVSMFQQTSEDDTQENVVNQASRSSCSQPVAHCSRAPLREVHISNSQELHLNASLSLRFACSQDISGTISTDQTQATAASLPSQSAKLRVKKRTRNELIELLKRKCKP